MKFLFLFILLSLQTRASSLENLSGVDSCLQGESFEDLSKLEVSACEIEKKIKCENILSSSPDELKDSYKSLCSPASSSLTIQASLSCSGLALDAGMALVNVMAK